MVVSFLKGYAVIHEYAMNPYWDIQIQAFKNIETWESKFLHTPSCLRRIMGI
jgi:hypothetical protein